MTARYWIDDNQQLGFRVTARTDAPTVCNFTCHNYFNRDGEATIENHRLQVDATKYLPVDAEGVPTGGFLGLAYTRFDFRQMRSLRQGDQIAQLDHNFCLPDTQLDLRKVAKLRSTHSNISMNIATTEPGLQVYTGAKINAHLANPLCWCRARAAKLARCAE